MSDKIDWEARALKAEKRRDEIQETHKLYHDMSVKEFEILKAERDKILAEIKKDIEDLEEYTDELTTDKNYEGGLGFVYIYTARALRRFKDKEVINNG